MPGHETKPTYCESINNVKLNLICELNLPFTLNPDLIEPHLFSFLRIRFMLIASFSSLTTEEAERWLSSFVED